MNSIFVSESKCFRRLDSLIASVVKHLENLAYRQPKQISKINCVAKAVPVNGRARETDFTHTCDTVGGSSGSPVFNEVGQVVGLNHYGFGTGGEWNENRAIRINRIVDHLAIDE